MNDRRQARGDGGPFADLRFDVDRAVMQIDRAQRQRQAQAAAAVLGREIEIEDALEKVRRLAAAQLVPSERSPESGNGDDSRGVPRLDVMDRIADEHRLVGLIDEFVEREDILAALDFARQLSQIKR